jgi:hypothetical protein
MPHLPKTDSAEGAAHRSRSDQSQRPLEGSVYDTPARPGLVLEMFALVLQSDPTWPLLATAAAGIARRLPNASHQILPIEAVLGIDPGGAAAAIREFEP